MFKISGIRSRARDDAKPFSHWMECEEKEITGCSPGEFMCFIRDQTPHAVKISVPERALDVLPQSTRPRPKRAFRFEEPEPGLRWTSEEVPPNEPPKPKGREWDGEWTEVPQPPKTPPKGAKKNGESKDDINPSPSL